MREIMKIPAIEQKWNGPEVEQKMLDMLAGH
jgi:hypothetical protein